ncbi:flotillin family protein [Nesterenkonia xinjiangensis]|uniref:Flotillin n=1 Tax=Nesterenkonia xinjiangensis TaxID=225327 RepID=A0A7Z0KBT1_9MICC|nr:SPFH domain-containing protein [Nesterenkonia xinjiangensis]NYJ79610.1 flotillin [Nesterenkonia xinjiangensis]
MLETLLGASLFVPILGLILVVVVAIAAIVARYRIAKPNEAIIVSGSGSKRSADSGLPATQKIVQGGGTFVLPFVQKSDSMSLESRKVLLETSAITQNGINLHVEAVALVKVDGKEDSIRAAAQRFLGQQQEIERFTKDVLEASLRSILGTMTVEQVNREREAFATRALDESESTLTNQGLLLDAFQIQGISDDNDYLVDLGRPEAAKVKRDADIAEENARRESERAHIAAEQEILESQRELDLRNATIREETDQAKAKAAAAGPRAEAEAQRAVVDQQRETAERRAQLREQELVAEVHKQADADRYRAEQEAEARRVAEVSEAQAQAERVRLAAEADLDRREKEARAVLLEGEAEAAAIRERGQAEALALHEKGEAYRSFGQAAIMDRIIATLPEIAHEAAAPMNNIDSLTVIDSAGANKVVKNGIDNVNQAVELASSTLGVDLRELLKNFTGQDLTATGVQADHEQSSAEAVTDGDSEEAKSAGSDSDAARTSAFGQD